MPASPDTTTGAAATCTLSDLSGAEHVLEELSVLFQPVYQSLNLIGFCGFAGFVLWAIIRRPLRRQAPKLSVDAQPELVVKI